jgi:hypothetical protein
MNSKTIEMKIESERLYIKPFKNEDFENFASLHKNGETAKLMGKELIFDEEMKNRIPTSAKNMIKSKIN